jgi:hypothetical protein
MDPSVGATTSTERLLVKASAVIVVAVSGAHTPFIANGMLLVDSNRLVTGFLFPEDVGSTYRGASRMAALGR